MLYRIVKWIIRLTLNSYFRRIVIKGYENVPIKGATIFVANHPSAFMDPMVVAAIIKRPLHFMAAAEFFGKGLKSWVYSNYLNMIPVYRPSTLPNETHNNDTIFLKCFELLGDGGALLVFPEGNSVTEKRIRKLKTGVARMALGTRENSSSKVEVNVIPVGLNYNNPHRFQSDLFINIGKPLSTKDFSSDKSEVVRFTEELEVRLKGIILHVQYEELDSVVKKVEFLLTRKFQESDSSPSQRESKFIFQKKVIESLQKLSEHQPHEIVKLERKLNDYLAKLKKFEIADRSIADLSILISTREFLRLIFALPIFLIGFVINAIPYYATVFYFRKLNLFSRDGFKSPTTKINPAFKGSIAMAIGMMIFIICYLTMAVVSGWVTKYIWLGFFSLILFYLSGLFAMRYIRWVLLFKQKWKFRGILKRKPALFSSLIVERQEIIEELKLVVE